MLTSSSTQAEAPMFADLVPILFLVLLAAGVLWIVWRLARRLGRSPAQRPEPVVQSPPAPSASRQAPVLHPPARPPSTIPDAADVLALKAAIDNLARQVAALERRLASNSVNQPLPQPSPSGKAVERPATLSEAPLVVPDHRV
jgi:hypothetical protein